MQRRDQKNPQTNYRKHFMSTKEQQNRAILATSSISTYDNVEMRHIQTKTSIWIHSCSNQIWNRVAKVSVKIKDEESSNHNLVLIWRNSMQKLMHLATMLTRTLKIKRGVSNFLHLCPDNTWAPSPRLVWISKTSILSSLRRPETLPIQAGPPSISWSFLLHY